MKSAGVLCIAGILVNLPAVAANLATYGVSAQTEGASFTATGIIEAVRQGTLGSQASGRVTQVLVRNGDDVKAGQPLIQIEAGDSGDTAVASDAAASGAAARLVSARADDQRAQRLRAQDYISVAAMQRAEAALRSAEADAQATGAQAKGARTRAAWHTVTAPYSGHVTESLAARVQSGQAAELVVGTSAPIVIATWRVIPAIDPLTHSVELRAELPAGTGLEPGQFASLLLPLREASSQLRIPLSAILRRSEVIGVYVVDGNGAAHLRQVRLGPVIGKI